MNLIHLNICNINSEIKVSGDSNFYQILKKRYQNFLGSLNKEPIDLVLSLKTFPSPTNDSSNDDPLSSVKKNGWFVKGYGFNCNISNKTSRFSGSGTCQENIYAFDSLLRVLWTQLLLTKNGFLIHACGIRNGSTSYLFPGSSGSGKSTLAKKALSSDVLSDELIGLQIKDGKPLLMGTPFWGEFQQGGLPATQPLHGIYFLQQSNSLRINKISPKDAVKNLLRLVLFFSDDIISTQKLLKLVRQCVLNTPGYKIYLPKNTCYKDIIKMIVSADCFP